MGPPGGGADGMVPPGGGAGVDARGLVDFESAEAEDDFASARVDEDRDDEAKEEEEEEEDDPGETLVTFNLPIVHRLHRTGFEEEKDFPVRIGDVVAGRYELTEYLGSAAFSKAVQAVDLDTGDVVCLKIVKNNKDYFDQSLDEIKLLRYINDEDPDDAKGILRMYDYFYHREHLFIVTELLRANLYEFQRYNLESGEEPYFTLSALKKISRQLLTSLEYLHSLDLIHCDLKPENILIKSYSRCEVKVIDFGSSCYVTDHLSSYVQSRSYRAPEVILGAPYDTKVDTWSLGCILAELYTGEVLLHNDSLASLLARCVGIFGPFDPRLLRRGRYSANYFTKSGLVYERCEKTETLRLMRPKKTTLARRLGLDPEVDEAECGSDGFVGFLLGLLAVNPDERLTATRALAHPWLAEEERREDDEKREGAAAAEEGDTAVDGETKADEDGGVSPDLTPTEANIEAKEEAAEPRMVEARL
uniref:Protein kinase domain-containing protein n=1 Tax=Micromonas pusilla TaxID=38833 RepID=A0A7S0I930_MICPS